MSNWFVYLSVFEELYDEVISFLICNRLLVSTTLSKR